MCWVVTHNLYRWVQDTLNRIPHSRRFRVVDGLQDRRKAGAQGLAKARLSHVGVCRIVESPLFFSQRLLLHMVPLVRGITMHM